MTTKTIKPSHQKLAQAIAIAACALAANQAQAVNYTFSDLGTIATGDTYKYFIGGNNNPGQVLATRYNSDFSVGEVVVWKNGNWNALDDYPGSSGSMGANALNDTGQVGGNSYDVPNDLGLPVIWNGKTPSTLNRINNESWFSTVLALNDNNQAAGAAWVASAGAFQAVRWDGDNIVQLSTLGGAGSYAASINDAGEIVGRSSTTDDEAVKAAYWAADGSITELGGLGGTIEDTAWSINNSGQIVGNSFLADNATYRPVLWNDSNASPIDLGTLAGTSGSTGLAGNINTQGQIIGYSNFDDADHGKFAATLWDNGQTINLSSFFPADLVAEGWHFLPGVIEINDDGVVVGQLKNDVLSQYTVFQLTPTSVPVPGAVWLFGSVLAGFCASRQRKAFAA